MTSHEVDYEIIGDDMQVVEVELDPGRSGDSRGGQHELHGGRDHLGGASMGDGSEANRDRIMGKLLGAGKRVLTGESIFMTHFTNSGAMARNGWRLPRRIPGKIIPD